MSTFGTKKLTDILLGLIVCLERRHLTVPHFPFFFFFCTAGVSCSQSREEMRPAVFSGGASVWFRLTAVMYAELFLMVAVAVDLAIRNLGTWLAMDF
jgi:hypothetical protein